ncbi:MAG: DUF1292 domain-containing protein [Bacilli bacterium]|nr:DUF1292 domain-containing protein [Bacilli bacterium]
MLEIKDNNDFIVTGDDGLEELLKILFYYHNDERGKDYYFLYRPEAEDDVFVLCSSDGNSLEVPTEEEFAEAQEVFEAYDSDPNIASIK